MFCILNFTDKENLNGHNGNISVSLCSGKGALTTHLPQELASLGHKALILQDPVVYERYQDTLASALHGVLDFEIEVFNSECSDEEIARISARAQQVGADVIVGMGGGKTLDTAKATGASLRLPIAVVPTLASTDAPCSSLVVIYTQEGQFKRYLMIPVIPRWCWWTAPLLPPRQCVS